VDKFEKNQRDCPFRDDDMQRWVAELQAELDRHTAFDKQSLGALAAFCDAERHETPPWRDKGTSAPQGRRD